MSLDPKDIPSELELSRDSEDAFHVYLTDERNLFEDLSVFDDGRVEIKASLTGTALVTRRVGVDMTINVSENRLEADALTVGELALLDAGRYVADVIVHHQAQNRWHRADRFYVDVLEGVTDVP